MLKPIIDLGGYGMSKYFMDLENFRVWLQNHEVREYFLLQTFCHTVSDGGIWHNTVANLINTPFTSAWNAIFMFYLNAPTHTSLYFYYKVCTH